MENMGVTERLRQAYQGKRVLVTGHTGFKGAWMLLCLQRLGAEVKGYALEPKQPNDLYYQINGDSLCESVIADIRHKEQLAHAIHAFQPDYIFHMAAQALVLDSYEIPAETYETNVLGTVYVLDALRTLEKPCKTVVITTDKVYENLERSEPYAEHERLGGHDPYSNSKACAELATSSYRLSFFPPAGYANHYQSIATVRSGNVIGGGDWSENRIIPDLVRSLQQNEPLIVRNPSAVRPWQHVLEPVFGYLMLGACMEEDPVRFADAYNFGPRPKDELTVRELVEIAIDKWGSGTYSAPELANQPHEANLLKLAIDKAESELGWTPRFTSAESIGWTMEWYKESEADPRAFTESQIDRYLNLLA